MTEYIVPDWPAPPRVKALVTTRQGGVSASPWASLNLGDHVGDDSFAVQQNRDRLRQALPSEPKWLRQVHGTNCVDAASIQGQVEADASFTRQAGVVCAVLTADCLPVFFCDDQARAVAVAHAGWRGLANGVLEATIAAMKVDPAHVLAWLGPAIGPQKFEVGPEVRDIFVSQSEDASAAFVAANNGSNGKWLADIYLLARLRIQRVGVSCVFGPTSEPGASGTSVADCCTVSQSERFFSYRRDGVTGRMASCIWLTSDS